MAFETSLIRLKEAVDTALKNRISMQKVDPEKAIYNFDKKKEQYFIDAVHTNKRVLRQDSQKLKDAISHNPANEVPAVKMLVLVNQLEKEEDLNKMKDIISMIQLLYSQLNLPPESDVLKMSRKLSFPEEIREEMHADLKELDLCFRNGCLRSATIICGRLLETALHRKYFEETGVDLLEKSPGIGLGKIIAHFDEKKIHIDPALKQQIHLINQVRIFSVHKKQETFYPSPEQAHAIVLYTLDVLGRMFEK